METILLTKLEQALFRRNPALAEKLQPGVPTKLVCHILEEAGVAGNIEALVALYGWKNGVGIHSRLAAGETTFFPDAMYQFLSLESSVEHLSRLREAARGLVKLTGDPTGLSEGVDRFFPVLWDGSTGYLAVDVKPSNNNRVVLLEFESVEPFRELYSSFEEFLRDTIRANEEGGL